jgi:hypothetical protein
MSEVKLDMTGIKHVTGVKQDIKGVQQDLKSEV